MLHRDAKHGQLQGVQTWLVDFEEKVPQSKSEAPKRLPSGARATPEDVVTGDCPSHLLEMAMNLL